MKISKRELLIGVGLGFVTYLTVSKISKNAEKNSSNNFKNSEKVIVNPTEIDCHNCSWNWKVKDGGNDLFICHQCFYDNSKFYKFTDLNT